MRVVESKVRKLLITDLKNQDAITVYIEDFYAGAVNDRLYDMVIT